MGNDAVVSFRGASKIYSRSHLGRKYYSCGIADLTLEIAKGEAFGLLGLNGSGKTTTFKLLLGLLRPTSGEVSIFSMDPSHPKTYSQLGYLPELPYFPSFLTPDESLLFYGRLSGIPEYILPEKIKEALQSVGLLVHRSRKIRELSKGLVQRLGLAQAILHDPNLLILDEPASGLDPLAIKDMRDLLAHLSESGKTLLVSSHSISEVEKICHRVGILKEGRLVRLLKRGDWEAERGGLESLFVETLR